MVFLTGFMGTGKSASGRRAAEILGYGFADTDAMAERAFSKKISDVFREEGEGVFRAKERDVLAEAVKLSPCMVSTGGGAACYADNLDFMKSHGMVIALLASPETIFSRVSASKTPRPLLQCENPLGRIRKLLQERAYYYINSHTLIDTDGKNAETVAKEIAAAVSKRRF